MRISEEQVPAKIDVPGAVARQIGSFGAASGTMAGEWFSLGAGTDIQPLLKGLEDDACQAPHWGYMLSGELVVTFTDGTAETCSGNDLFYWPPGHSVWGAPTQSNRDAFLSGATGDNFEFRTAGGRLHDAETRVIWRAELQRRRSLPPASAPPGALGPTALSHTCPALLPPGQLSVVGPAPADDNVRRFKMARRAPCSPENTKPRSPCGDRGSGVGCGGADRPLERTVSVPVLAQISARRGLSTAAAFCTLVRRRRTTGSLREEPLEAQCRESQRHRR